MVVGGGSSSNKEVRGEEQSVAAAHRCVVSLLGGGGYGRGHHLTSVSTEYGAGCVVTVNMISGQVTTGAPAT